MDPFIKIDAADLFIRVNPSEFGRIFAGVDSDDQVMILNAMVEHMRPWRLQWDYISIELEKPENHELRDVLREVLFPAGA